MLTVPALYLGLAAKNYEPSTYHLALATRYLPPIPEALVPDKERRAVLGTEV